MNNKNYDAQLDQILAKIVRDYNVGLNAPNWSQLLAHEKVQSLLVNHHLLVIITNQPDNDLAEALHECFRNLSALYNYLVLHLFSSVVNKSLELSYYVAEDFLVLVFNGPADPVIDAIGLEVIPFVSEYFQRELPDRWQNRNLASRVLKQLYANHLDGELRAGIMNRVDPMRIQRLRPLALAKATRLAQELVITTGPNRRVPEIIDDEQATPTPFQLVMQSYTEPTSTFELFNAPETQTEVTQKASNTPQHTAESEAQTVTPNESETVKPADSMPEIAEPTPPLPPKKPDLSPDEVLLGRKRKKGRTAPLPDFFNRDDPNA